jgi:hypothetical protein
VQHPSQTVSPKSLKIGTPQTPPFGPSAPFEQTNRFTKYNNDRNFVDAEKANGELQAATLQVRELTRRVAQLNRKLQEMEKNKEKSSKRRAAAAAPTGAVAVAADAEVVEVIDA